MVQQKGKFNYSYSTYLKPKFSSLSIYEEISFFLVQKGDSTF